MRIICTILALAAAFSTTDIASAQPFNPVLRDIRTAVNQGSVAADREALEALYEATGGPEWSDRANWLSAAPLGQWFGVGTNSNGRVTRLALPGNGLSGEIPSALGRLASLERLDLGARWVDGVGWVYNDLSGEIPTELAALTNLRILEIRGNRLLGTIPPELASLAKLQWLDLRDNRLSGAVPRELSNLSNLHGLRLNGNELSGAIPPELSALANLQALELGGNRLFGAIPPELGGLANLRWLGLGGNQLSGAIPPELGGLMNLQSLSLGANRLSGTVPPELGALANLQRLYLERNQLEGKIPWNLMQLSELTTLDISDTGVCVPTDASIQAWLATIADFRTSGLACDGSLRVAFSGSRYVVREGGSVEVRVRLIDQTNGPALSVTIPLTVTPGGGATEEDYTGVPDGVTITAPASTGTFVVTAVADPHHDHAETITLGFRRPLPSGVTTSSPDTAVVTIYDPGSQATDRDALEAFYHATGGPEWRNRANWLSGAPLGEWYGVETDSNGRVRRLSLPFNELIGTIPLQLGSLSNLQGLNLWGNELNGAIPPELGSLANLKWLNLRRNELSGAIPPVLGSLSNLEELNLGRNNLSGAIPPELADLINLQKLDLGANELRGAIPPVLGALSNLQELDLPVNELSGAIPPELADLTNLQELSLAGNELSGAIPLELGALSNLEQLFLGRNNLSGAIPPELADLYNLQWLDLRVNNLSGAIPPELGALSNLQRLFLTANELIGEIPPVLGDLTNLWSLDLGGNELSGAIPPELGALTNLQWLSLSSNRLNGKIPLELMQLSELDLFRIANTDVCVPTSDEFQAWLATISDFRSSEIACDGSLQVAFSESSYVVREGESIEVSVYLIDQTAGPAPSATIPLRVTPGGGASGQDYAVAPDRVTITAPASTGTFLVTAVEDRRYDHGETITLGFRRPLPTGVTAGSPDTATVTIIDPGTVVLTDRQVLEALYEAFGGPEWRNRTKWLSEAPIGEWFGVEADSNGRVTSLALPGNGLSGEILPVLGRLASLERLDLGARWDPDAQQWVGNDLSGEIPLELGVLSNLQVLNLRGNELSGEIPPELGELTNLRVLNLGDNELSGAIPPELGRLASLERLDLGARWDPDRESIYRGNDLSGAIPPELGALTNLQFLNLGHNNLSGAIPPELGVLTNLEWLNLQRNELRGAIPPELGDLTKLQVLRLPFNDLSGAIPPELGVLSNLRVLHLWGNDLSGEIPPELADLTNLQVLELGGNELSGEIPPELGDLTNLRRLHLWGNDLSGEIPPELGDLSNLQELGLQFTELSGEIPPELADLTNLRWLSLAATELSGEIPPELGDLTNLRWLSLGANELSGEIPPELGGLTNLTGLSLAGTELSGEIPPELGGLSNLQGLYLWGTELSGEIPPELADLSNLSSLDLGFNPNMTGPIPRQLVQLTLGSLNLMATGVCIPSDEEFQEWLAEIDRFTPSGAICGRIPEEMTSIDVAVFYTPTARRLAGGTTEIEAEIDLMVAETNQAYEDGGVNQRIVLAVKEEVRYEEENASGGLALRRFARERDGYMDEVHEIRDRVGADLVHLIAEVTDVGGAAYFGEAFGLTSSGSDANVFAHELGHNMGLSHDRYVDIGRLPYSYGYVNQRAFEDGAPESSRWRTIMAYAHQCADARFRCDWLLRFSNPNQSYLGDPLGVPGESRTLAVNGPADAVRALNLTRHSVAAFRPRSQDKISRARSGGKQAARPAPAAGVRSGGLFTAISPPKHGAAESEPKALRRREVAVDIGQLSQVAADRPTALPLNLFDDVMLTGVIVKRAPTFSGGYALTGPLFGVAGGTVALVVNGDVVAGTVRLPGATYRIRPAGAGRHAIVQDDPSNSSWRCGTEPWPR